jgi:uncharacterized protein YcbK (DUF882 family)
MLLTPHFSVAEFVDKRANVRQDPPTMLLGVLENLRGQVGRPLPIVSGYRTVETNRAVGGAADSRHLHGDAADLPRGYATVAQAQAAGAVGIGSAGPWAVHVDVRPGPPARWEY